MQQRCHTIVNYDLPWNPNVLQQRIGRVYRYGQTKPVVVYNLKVETDSDAYADNKVYEYLEKKLGDVADALAKAQGEGMEDLLGDVLGQAAEHGLSLEALHQKAIEKGQSKVEETINEKAKDLEEIMRNPEMTGMFKGLSRFNLEDYKKVQSRVTSDHLEFFVKQYCENARLGYRDEGGSASRSSLRRNSSNWLTSGRSGINTPLWGGYRPRRWGMRRSTRRSRRGTHAYSVLETRCLRRWWTMCDIAIFRPSHHSMCRRRASDGRAGGRGRGCCSSFR